MGLIAAHPCGLPIRVRSAFLVSENAAAHTDGNSHTDQTTGQSRFSVIPERFEHRAVRGTCGMRRWLSLRKDAVDQFSMHVGQSALDAVVVIRQPFVFDAEQMQDRRVEVVPRDAVLDRLPTDLIR